jgi:hypothetical protein
MALDADQLAELHGWISRRALEGDTQRLADALHAVVDLDVDQLLGAGAGPFSSLGADEAITAAQAAVDAHMKR